jgi:hypothetical protein
MKWCEFINRRLNLLSHHKQRAIHACAVSRQHLTTEARIRSCTSPMWDMWLKKRHFDTCSPHTLLFPCQYHSTNIPRSIFTSSATNATWSLKLKTSFNKTLPSLVYGPCPNCCERAAMSSNQEQCHAALQKQRTLWTVHTDRHQTSSQHHIRRQLNCIQSYLHSHSSTTCKLCD